MWSNRCATHTADAHGIAGNRYFDGTLSFDDPAVADEAILPYYAQLDFPAQRSNTSENRLNYVALTWKIAAEAIIPLNRAGGSGTGFRAQLLFFPDDLIPSVKPC